MKEPILYLGKGTGSNFGVSNLDTEVHFLLNNSRFLLKNDENEAICDDCHTAQIMQYWTIFIKKSNYCLFRFRKRVLWASVYKDNCLRIIRIK